MLEYRWGLDEFSDSAYNWNLATMGFYDMMQLMMCWYYVVNKQLSKQRL